MAGVGQNFVLDKAFPVIATYNSSAAAGVVAKRCVKFSATVGSIDLNVAVNTRSVGVVMENVDQVKVATGKVNVDVRMMGIATINCTTAASVVLGSLVMSSTVGGVLLLATTGSFLVGMAVGITGTLADGNDIQVLLVPGVPAIP